MRFVIAFLAVALIGLDASAAGRRHRAAPTTSPHEYNSGPQAISSPVDALDEVNAARQARGLKPFIHDPALTIAARSAASARGLQGLFGHLTDAHGYTHDLEHVPPGAKAASAGCAAYPASYGWRSCCTYDAYTYAGAAYVVGADKRRYMHLFVR